jgi:hypothetical protein
MVYLEGSRKRELRYASNNNNNNYDKEPISKYIYMQSPTDAIPAFQLANQNRGSQKTNVDKGRGLEPNA